jgi:hypothetical protein
VTIDEAIKNYLSASRSLAEATIELMLREREARVNPGLGARAKQLAAEQYSSDAWDNLVRLNASLREAIGDVGKSRAALLRTIEEKCL